MVARYNELSKVLTSDPEGLYLEFKYVSIETILHKKIYEILEFLLSHLQVQLESGFEMILSLVSQTIENFFPLSQYQQLSRKIIKSLLAKSSFRIFKSQSGMEEIIQKLNPQQQNPTGAHESEIEVLKFHVDCCFIKMAQNFSEFQRQITENPNLENSQISLNLDESKSHSLA